MSISTSEMWTAVLWQTTDAVGVDQEPQKDYQKYYGSVLTMFLLFVISLLFLNLGFGVVTETFNRQKQLSSLN